MPNTLQSPPRATSHVRMDPWGHRHPSPRHRHRAHPGSLLHPHGDPLCCLLCHESENGGAWPEEVHGTDGSPGCRRGAHRRHVGDCESVGDGDLLACRCCGCVVGGQSDGPCPCPYARVSESGNGVCYDCFCYCCCRKVVKGKENKQIYTVTAYKCKGVGNRRGYSAHTQTHTDVCANKCWQSKTAIHWVP